MGRPHDSGSEDADEGELGSQVMHQERRPQRMENRKVGTCPGTSSCRMILSLPRLVFVFSHFFLSEQQDLDLP